MEIQRVCKKCGEVNEIDSSNLVRKDVHDEYGNYYKLMYCDCVRCGTRDFVQIDDKNTLEEFKRLKKLIIKVARKNINGQTISQKDIKKKDKMMKQIREDREKLKEICAGKKYFDENEKIIAECLTFEKVGDIIESNL
nr:MAG TPA: hypothetical protein [Caudoviricetes sp.]